MELRTRAIFKHFELDWAAAHDRITFYSGFGNPVRFAVKDRDKIKDGPYVNEIIALCKRDNIGLICVDPLISTHDGLKKNDNGEMNRLMDVYRRIASEANVAILLIHHSRKLDKASSEGHAGSIKSGRGASALKDAARIGLTLYGMTEDDALRMGGKSLVPRKHRYVRLDETEKFNVGLQSPTAQWFKRTSVLLRNAKGEEEWLGVLVPCFLGNDTLEDVQKVITTAIKAGERLSPSKQANNSAARWLVQQQHNPENYKEDETKAARDRAQES